MTSRATQHTQNDSCDISLYRDSIHPCDLEVGTLEENRIYGWFDDPDQTTPTYEPPRDAPCLFCGKQVHAGDVRTHGLMYQGEYAARSYFYRTHRTCAEKDKTHTAMDGLVLEMIARNGD